MKNKHCLAKTAAGERCKGKPNSSGYCSVHDPARMEREERSKAKKHRFQEVVDTILRTARAKGWTAIRMNRDTKNWKYGAVNVKRRTSSDEVEGNFDITIENGVKINRQLLTPFSNQGNALIDLHDAIMSELGRLPGLKPPEKNLPPDISVLIKIERLLKRFHKVAKQLQHRHDGRETIVINDEYDVQDLLHSLLCVYFDDIRPEEHTPSYAGGASRVDFLLKAQKIVIETKITSPKLRDKQIGEQLIIDIKRYQAHPDCRTLVCFVYDPGGFLKNPAGLSTDLSRKHDQLTVRVIIVPS
jgi:hypothetical protein